VKRYRCKIYGIGLGVLGFMADFLFESKLLVGRKRKIVKQIVWVEKQMGKARYFKTTSKKCRTE